MPVPPPVLPSLTASLDAPSIPRTVISGVTGIAAISLQCPSYVSPTTGRRNQSAVLPLATWFLIA